MAVTQHAFIISLRSSASPIPLAKPGPRLQLHNFFCVSGTLFLIGDLSSGKEPLGKDLDLPESQLTHLILYHLGQYADVGIRESNKMGGIVLSSYGGFPIPISNSHLQYNSKQHRTPPRHATYMANPQQRIHLIKSHPTPSNPTLPIESHGIKSHRTLIFRGVERGRGEMLPHLYNH